MGNGNTSHGETGEALSRVASLLMERDKKPRDFGSHIAALCPSHADARASLSVSQGTKGVVMKCHAGCTTDMICTALGLKITELFDKPMENGKGSNGNGSSVVDRYSYEDEKGAVLFEVERLIGKGFRQRRKVGGEWVYQLGDVRRVPYRLRKVREAAAAGQTIWITEGEKDVHTLEAMGLVATTNPGGAGKWRGEFNPHLRGADVICLPDNDEQGRLHMNTVADALAPLVKSVRILRLPGVKEKGDVTDWQEGGGDVAQLVTLAAACPCHEGSKPVFINAPDLMAMSFPELRMAIPGLISEGFTFLVGPPKVGKSWMSLGLGMAVAAGGPALGSIPTSQGSVLYVALEDTPRRLQSRLSKLLGMGSPPYPLHFTCNWPKLGQGGLEQLENWLQEHQDAKMVIFDTWGKVKSRVNQADSMYESDYDAVSEVKKIADQYGVAIVAVHHQRKMKDDDPLNTVLGSQGLTGGADAICILTRPRGAEDGYLYVTGRDVPESRAAVKYDYDTGAWLWLGEAEEIEANRTEESIIKLLNTQVDPLSPQDVAQMCEMKQGTAKWLLSKMAQEEKIAKLGRGKYVSLANYEKAKAEAAEEDAPTAESDIFEQLEAELGGEPEDDDFGLLG